MHTALDLEVVTRDIERLEEEVRARLARIRNLKLIKQRIIRQLNQEGK